MTNPDNVGGLILRALGCLELLDNRPRPQCRDCADNDGVCPSSGLDCDMRALVVGARRELGELCRAAPAGGDIERDADYYSAGYASGYKHAAKDAAPAGGDWRTAPYAATDDAIRKDSGMTLHDRVEYALREAGFDHGEASRIASMSATAGGEPNGKLVGWWNGITPGFDGMGIPSIRWGADAENSGHDIPLYDGYNQIHYVTPVSAPAGSGEVEDYDSLIAAMRKGHEVLTNEKMPVSAELMRQGADAISNLRNQSVARTGGVDIEEFREAVELLRLTSLGGKRDCERHGTFPHDFDRSLAEADRLLALIDSRAALLRKLQQGADGWRPIESAPKGDRRVVLLVSNNGPNGYITDPWTGWVNSDGSFARWPHRFPPTHWMAISPKYPARAASQDQEGGNGNR